MKRTITVIVLTLMLSLLLNGCAEMADRGNVGTSPAPEVTSPTQILPSPDVSAMPFSDGQNGSGNQGNIGSGTNSGYGINSGSGTSSGTGSNSDSGSMTSPAPTSAAR